MGRGAWRRAGTTGTGAIDVRALSAPPPATSGTVVTGTRRGRAVVVALGVAVGLAGVAALVGAADRPVTGTVPAPPLTAATAVTGASTSTAPAAPPTVVGLGPPPEVATGTILWSANSLGLVQMDLDAGEARLIPMATGVYDGGVMLAVPGGLVAGGGSGPARFLPFSGAAPVTLWPGPVLGVFPGPDAGSVRLVVGGPDRVVTVLLASGTTIGEAPVPAFARVVGTTGRWVVLAAPGAGYRWAPDDGTVEWMVGGVPTGVIGASVHAVVCDETLSCRRELIEVRSGARTTLPSCAEPAAMVVPSPAGRWVAVVQPTGEIVVCDDTGEVHTFDEFDGVRPSWSADGGLLFWESSGAVKVWPVGAATPPLVYRLPANLPLNGLVAVPRR